MKFETPIVVEIQISRMDGIRETAGFHVSLRQDMRTAFNGLNLDRDAQVAGLANGFDPVKPGQGAVVDRVELAPDVEAETRFIEHHRSEARSGNQHRETLTGPAGTDARGPGQTRLVKRKLSLQGSEHEEVDEHSPERRPKLEVHPFSPCSGQVQIRMTQEFSIILSADEAAKAEAAAALYRYNVAITGTDDRIPIGAVLCAGSGKALGGLWGRTELGLLFLDMFFVPAHLRGLSYGGQLLAAVEEEAKARGCRRAVVETSSFQAPGFYIRHGYVEFGRVPFGFDRQARVFLRKELA